MHVWLLVLLLPAALAPSSPASAEIVRARGSGRIHSNNVSCNDNPYTDDVVTIEASMPYIETEVVSNVTRLRGFVDGDDCDSPMTPFAGTKLHEVEVTVTQTFRTTYHGDAAGRCHAWRREEVDGRVAGLDLELTGSARAYLGPVDPSACGG